jgi:hypothetical protein
MISIRKAKKLGIWKQNTNQILQPTHFIDPDISLEALHSHYIDEDIRGMQGILIKKDLYSIFGQAISDFRADKEIILGYTLPINYAVPTIWLKEIPEPAR